MTTAYDPTEGITSKTTKEDLLVRLDKAKDWIRRNDPEKQKQSRLAEVEARLHEKYRGVSAYDNKTAMVNASAQEWAEAVAFLREFDDLLPPLLRRVVEGGTTLLGQHPAQKAPTSV